MGLTFLSLARNGVSLPSSLIPLDFLCVLRRLLRLLDECKRERVNAQDLGVKQEQERQRDSCPRRSFSFSLSFTFPSCFSLSPSASLPPPAVSPVPSLRVRLSFIHSLTLIFIVNARHQQQDRRHRRPVVSRANEGVTELTFPLLVSCLLPLACSVAACNDCRRQQPFHAFAPAMTRSLSQRMD